jgi:putative ABC transport system permease protein
MTQTIWHDIRDGGRILAKYPGYAALSLLVTFAFCWGTLAAVSVLMKAAHRRNPAKGNAGQFVVIAERESDGPAGLSFSYPMHLGPREKDGLAAEIASRCRLNMNSGNSAADERVRAEFVSGNYFEVLGARPLLGRLISEADDHDSIASPVAVISYDFWKSRFGMDPSTINRTLILDGHRFIVIGVTSPGFAGTDRLNRADIQVPLSIVGAFAVPILHATRVDPMESRAMSWRL